MLFVDVRQKSSDGKTRHPPSYPYFFFHTRNFLKHKKVPLRNFSVLWNRKFSTQNRDIPLLWLKFFNTRKKWNSQRFPYESFGTVRHEKSTENRVNPPFWLIMVISPTCKNSSVTRNFVIQKRVRYEVFQENETKNSPTENRKTPLPPYA